MRRAITFTFAALLTTLVGAVIGASSARAGTDTAELAAENTKPTDGATLSAAPSEVTISFNQRLPAMTPIVTIQNARNEAIRVGQPVTINNRMGLRVVVNEQNGLPEGKYTVNWLIRPTNGKPVSGKFSFTLVLEPTTNSTTVGTTTAPKPDTSGLDIPTYENYHGVLGTLGRTLAYLGLAGLAGALLLIATAWAEGVEYVLTVRFLYIAWGLGVIGNLLTVGTAAADANRISVARGLVPTEWTDELLKTTFGKAVVIRLVMMIGCLWVARRPERVVDSGTQLMGFALPLIALATYGWTNSAVDVKTTAIPAGIVHAIAGAAWFGGAALLARVVLAGPGDADLVGAIKGFRRIYLPAVLLVIVSGAVQTAIFLGGAGNLLDTKFGKIFLLKIIAVVVMAFVATANRDYARHRLARAQHLDARPAERLRRSVRTEVTAGAVVFLLAGWLVGTTPPGLIHDDTTSSNKNIYESADGTFRAEIKFGKTQVKAKVELHFRLLEPESIADGLITFDPVDGKSPGIQVPILGTPNYGFGPEQGFEFGSSGPWKITITGKGPDGNELPTITREFIVKNQDGSTPESTTSSVAPTTTRVTVAPSTSTTGG